MLVTDGNGYSELTTATYQNGIGSSKDLPSKSIISAPGKLFFTDFSNIPSSFSLRKNV